MSKTILKKVISEDICFLATGPFKARVIKTLEPEHRLSNRQQNKNVQPAAHWPHAPQESYEGGLMKFANQRKTLRFLLCFVLFFNSIAWFPYMNFADDCSS